MLTDAPTHMPKRDGPVGWILARLLTARQRFARGLASRRLEIALALFCGDILAAVISVTSINWAFTHSLLYTTSAMSRLFEFLGLATFLFIITLYRGNILVAVPRLKFRVLFVTAFITLSLIIQFITVVTSQGFLFDLTCAAVFLVLGLYIESFVCHALLKLNLWEAPAPIVGPGNVARDVCDLFSRPPDFGMRPVGLLLSPDNNFKQPPSSVAVPIVRIKSDIDRLEASPEIALLTRPDQHVRVNALYGKPASSPLQIYPFILGWLQHMWPLPRSLQNPLAFKSKRPTQKSIYLLIKRALDFVVAIIVGICVLPIIAVVCVTIKLMDPGPAFYVQKRVGQNGRIIPVIKIRSMYADSEKRLEELLRENPTARAEWERHFKLRDDPRILRGLGNIIRRSSIDELPQLWNVIRGDMSLVGPRPLPPYHIKNFLPEVQKKRASVPPGLTGFWQISSRSDGDLDIQQAEDLFYVKNHSIWFDLYILLQTPPAVLRAKGAR